MSQFSNRLNKTSSLLTALVCTAFLSACATPHNPDKYATIDNDPIEPFNRAIFQFNYLVDGVLIKPITEGYEALMPEKGQIMVSNLVDNLGEPVVFANSVVQADDTNSFTSLWRFIINSTVGIGGLLDPASEIGLKERATGFGDTLAVYGADAGPYIVLPLLGPSNLRDTIGRIGDIFADPITYANDPIRYSVSGIRTIDKRHRNTNLLFDIYNKSIDPYATMRSMYSQYREKEIKKAIDSQKNNPKKQCKGSDVK